jgi:hypothetical protein
LQPQTFAKEWLTFENLAEWQTFVSCCLPSWAQCLFTRKLLKVKLKVKVKVKQFRYRPGKAVIPGG